MISNSHNFFLLYMVALPLSTNKISATSELYCTLSYSLTKSPFGLDATTHAHVGRTVLYNKQISEWPLCREILMTPLTN
ncbi:hypothetical protein CMV_018650 [Castanea mollissima]|uniref:Secreted protein n=1 Tax=Castanea mollissima TaxID=60419 RepID=A0A8J4VHH0_9ROSI|nr:hypothetical protein CMV_018650 [Castanea mollissima]